MPELVCAADDPRWQDDTLNDRGQDVFPRAAGAVRTRGAQPPAIDWGAWAAEMNELSAATARLNNLARRNTRAHKSDMG